MRLWFVGRGGHSDEAADRLRRTYGDRRSENPDAIVVLGGNSDLIRLLPGVQQFKVPIFPMSLGQAGFLTNRYQALDLPLTIHQSQPAIITPVQVSYLLKGGAFESALAFNDVVLYRSSRSLAKMDILVDGTLRIAGLCGDGALVATPAGSTAYNLSARGPILPLTSKLLALTPLAPFHPRLWGGSVLPQTSRIVLSVQGDGPVELAADHATKGRVTHAEIAISDHPVTLLYANMRGFAERQLSEQFAG